MKTDPLHRSVHRLLLQRIAIVVLVTCLTFSAIAFFNNRNQIKDTVVELARLQSQRFNQEIIAVLDRPEGPAADVMQESMNQFTQASGPTIFKDGHFVLARVYDQLGNELGNLSDERFADINIIRKAFEDVTITPLAADDHRVVVTRLEGAPYVGVAVPLLNSRAEVVAQLVGAFAVSDAAIARVRGNVLRTILYVIGIVLATALALYPIISGLLGRLSRQTIQLLDANLEILQVLGGAIAKRDSDTDAHNYRVSVYSVRLAEAVGLPREQIKSLIKGALLHDVGKLGIRDNILLKPGKLDENEFSVMKTHVEHGLEITDRAAWLKDAQQVVGGHHEKYDGAGYPSGLKADEIPVTARIFAITDVFDALTSKRPYKDPLPFDETMDILEKGRGNHFDPTLLDAFKPIARELYDAYSGKDDNIPRQQLETMTNKYFKQVLADLLT
jgi:HD-GYP domain-containing protein (c-di-GMP phosphodiesterase class II)